MVSWKTGLRTVPRSPTGLTGRGLRAAAGCRLYESGGGIDLPSVGPDLRACRYSRRWTRNVPNRSKSLSFVRIPSIPCSRHTAAICASNIRLPCESASRAVVSSPRHELRAGLDNLATRRGDHSLNKVDRLCDRRGRIEHSPVGHHPHEFTDAEHRQCPPFHAFAEGDQPCRRCLVPFALDPVRINQDVRVNRYHGRSITS